MSQGIRYIHAEDVQSEFNIAIVVSRFNNEVTDKLLEGTLERLKELGFSDEQLTVAWVPGAVEIPLVVQSFARQDRYPVIIALGAVVRGGTGHYDFVCKQVSDGCQQLALQYHKPVVFGVLTTENQAQALDRVGGSHGHKGREAADCAYEMVSVMSQLD